MILQRWGIFAVLMLATATVEAGRIYGSLQVDGQAAPVGTKVVINCSSKSNSTEVQKHGRYSVNVDIEGPCSLSVEGYAGASIKVVSYNEATRYNFILTRSGNGFSIKRK